MRNRFPFWTAVLISAGVTWAVWNLLTIELTVEIAQIQDKWQPWLTMLRVLFPFMHFGASFLPDVISALAYVILPAAYLAFAMWLQKGEWSFKKGMLAGAVMAGVAGLAAFFSPLERQANRLYHIARGDIAEAAASFAIITAIEFVLAGLVLNAAVFFGARLVKRLADRKKPTQAEAGAVAEPVAAEAVTAEAGAVAEPVEAPDPGSS